MITLALAAWLAVPAAAAPAPEFKIAKVFNAPQNEIKSLASLKGKVVFLEFWATWCGPCVAGIPRTNRLIDSLKGEPVVFLAVTDEDAGMIAAYLKRHEMKAWVGVDEARSSFVAYKNDSRPDGWLIGKDGTLLAHISPDSLQEKDVREAVAGKFKPRADAAVAKKRAAPVEYRGEKNLFELTISSASGEPGMSFGGGELEANAMPFGVQIAWIWDVDQEQVLVENPPVEAFNFHLKTDMDALERGRELLKSAVQSTFGVTVAPETKETDVYLLALSTAPGAPRPSAGDAGLKSGIMASGGGRLLGKAPMTRHARALWTAAGRPVLDDTGLKGEFALDLEWKRGDAADRDRALAAAGLRLVPARRPVEYLRVRRNR